MAQETIDIVIVGVLGAAIVGLFGAGGLVWYFLGRAQAAEAEARTAKLEATELKNEKAVKTMPSEAVNAELVDKGVLKPSSGLLTGKPKPPIGFRG